MTAGRPALVLDTNVVLDWLVFAEPSVAHVARAVTDGRVVWIGTRPMLDELLDVIARPELARWGPDAAVVEAAWSRWCEEVSRPAPSPGPAPGPSPDAPAARPELRCADPDDQPFIDLALAARARWLLTRDRALLALARPAALRGVEILAPTRWRLPG